MERTKNKVEEPEKEEPILPQEETDKVEEQEPEEEKVEYVDPDPVIVWKKVGGGSLRLSNRLIPPGAIFKARVSEIPKAFRDLVVQMDGTPIPTTSELPPVKPVKTNYQVVPRGKSKSMFDVIGPNGKKINEQPLTKAVAERLAIDMS